MKNITLVFIALITLFSTLHLAHAETAAPVEAVTTAAPIEIDHSADHQMLREMLGKAVTIINEGRFDDLLPYFDPAANVIFQNGEVADGVDAIKQFEDRMFKGGNPVLKGHSVTATADKLTEFYGDTAVAYGTAIDHFSFVGGMELDLVSKWQTTLIKENAQWKVVSLQFTSNVFDNPLLSSANSTSKYAGVGGFVLGLIVCMIAVWLKNKKKQGVPVA